MVVAPKELEKVQKEQRKAPKRSRPMPGKTINEIEKELGIDRTKLRPIYATQSDNKEFEEKGDIFREWYEEELRTLYEGKDG